MSYENNECPCGGRKPTDKQTEMKAQSNETKHNRAYVVKRLRKISDEAYELGIRYRDSLKGPERTRMSSVWIKAKELADKIECSK